jgi:hypothetical protein
MPNSKASVSLEIMEYRLEQAIVLTCVDGPAIFIIFNAPITREFGGCYKRGRRATSDISAVDDECGKCATGKGYESSAP